MVSDGMIRSMHDSRQFVTCPYRKLDPTGVYPQIGRCDIGRSNQRMDFICIAFSRRKSRAKLRRARSGEFTARNSMSGGRRAGCDSGQVYRGRASGFQGAELTGIPPHSTHWCRHGLAEPEPPIKGLAPRFAGLWVMRASSPAPRTNGA